ncbi:hypothetical protein L6Q21_09820 [Sandaracinobacter sp. RS1-74]|uniref:hypothetical protein n=1 Tax=Sandaracinobacteroides sayramensis TaxID=2913411 RepID=UPI001EDBA045|nr:hypothetical protein [Sandaracinobacteroides sayramensis]MCG2841277.1 hypothetical protein [Sandaracinobacteroides sayramensis]
MRLSHELAARRQLYSFPLPTAPSVLVIDIPRRYAGVGLALGRYYPVIIETDDELAEFHAFLAADRPCVVPPDLLARRPSCRATQAITFFEYAPPQPGWPWLLLCHWPESFARRVETDPDMLARGAYTIETFADHRDLLAYMAQLCDMLGVQAQPKVVFPMTHVEGIA